MKSITIARVITSKIDPNYYIFDSKHKIELFSTITTLTDNNAEDCASILLGYFLKSSENFQKLFIEKSSHFGQVITKLIEQKEITEEDKVISQEIVINALINEIGKENPDANMIKILYQLIKTKDIGHIDELSDKYPKNILEQILFQGIRQEYLRKLNSDQTGLDEEGYFYQDNVWYQFNIKTKACTPIEEKKQVKKKKWFDK